MEQFWLLSLSKCINIFNMILISLQNVRLVFYREIITHRRPASFHKKLLHSEPKSLNVLEQSEDWKVQLKRKCLIKHLTLLVDTWSIFLYALWCYSLSLQKLQWCTRLIKIWKAFKRFQLKTSPRVNLGNVISSLFQHHHVHCLELWAESWLLEVWALLSRRHLSLRWQCSSMGNVTWLKIMMPLDKRKKINWLHVISNTGS